MGVFALSVVSIGKVMIFPANANTPNDYLLHRIFLSNFGGFTEMVTDIQTEGQMDGQRCTKEKFLIKHSIDAVIGQVNDIKGHANGVKGHADGVKGQLMA